MKPSVLKRIALGDVAAVRDCIDEYGKLVWSMARRLSRTRADAEDATQEIFLQIWRHAARFDDSLGTEKTFIAVIARRRLIDRLRRARAEPTVDSASELLDSLSSSGVDVGSAAQTSFEVELAMQALAGLRLDYRRVLELGILQGLAHAEIARRLGVPLGTVKSHMRRGLMQVRDSMNLQSRDEFDTPCAVRTEKKRRRSLCVPREPPLFQPVKKFGYS